MKPNPPSEKLHKVLARAGIGSRRQMEAWIQAGRVKVNGRVATLGDRVTATDKLSVDGKPVPITALKSKILMYHKPVGEICTRHDKQGRPTVVDQLPKLARGRWVSIGRLDINTSGLLLFTNDGDLANQMMHPSQEVEREYAVRVLGEVTKEMLQQLSQGVSLEDGVAHFDRIQDAGGRGVNHWYHVVVKEGRNRLVRRLWESQGVTVSRLIRIRYGDYAMPRSLRVGKTQYI